MLAKSAREKDQYTPNMRHDCVDVQCVKEEARDRVAQCMGTVFPSELRELPVGLDAGSGIAGRSRPREQIRLLRSPFGTMLMQSILGAACGSDEAAAKATECVQRSIPPGLEVMNWDRLSEDLDLIKKAEEECSKEVHLECRERENRFCFCASELWRNWEDVVGHCRFADRLYIMKDAVALKLREKCDLQVVASPHHPAGPYSQEMRYLPGHGAGMPYLPHDGDNPWPAYRAYHTLGDGWGVDGLESLMRRRYGGIMSHESLSSYSEHPFGLPQRHPYSLMTQHSGEEEGEVILKVQKQECWKEQASLEVRWVMVPRDGDGRPIPPIGAGSPYGMDGGIPYATGLPYDTHEPPTSYTFTPRRSSMGVFSSLLSAFGLRER